MSVYILKRCKKTNEQIEEPRERKRREEREKGGRSCCISRVSASAGALFVLRFSILFYFAERSGRFRIFVSKHS